MKKNKVCFSLVLLGLTCGLAFSNAPKTFEMVRADNITTVDAGYCSTYSEATKDGLYFEMLPNDAPYAQSTWSIRYRPMAPDCVTILRDGETHNLATNNLI